MEVVVIRHTPVQTEKDTCFGQTNVPLAASFLSDIEEIKNRLPNDFDHVFSSPLSRCKELANRLPHTTIELEDRLMEMNFGDWENKKWNEIDQTALNEWMSDFVAVKTPNGENLFEMYHRVSAFLDDLRQLNHKKVLLVTHAGVIRCIWAYVLKIPLQNMFKIPVGHQEIFAFNLAKSEDMDAIIQLK